MGLFGGKKGISFFSILATMILISHAKGEDTLNIDEYLQSLRGTKNIVLTTKKARIQSIEELNQIDVIKDAKSLNNQQILAQADMDEVCTALLKVINNDLRAGEKLDVGLSKNNLKSAYKLYKQTGKLNKVQYVFTNSENQSESRTLETTVATVGKIVITQDEIIRF